MRASEPNDVIAALADSQGGVVGRRQLRERGVTRGMVDRRVDKGILVELWPGVYRYGHRHITPYGRRRGALLALDDQAALGLRAAGAIWDLIGDRGPVSVIALGDRGRDLDGIRVHRYALQPQDIVEDNGLRLTTPMRTVFDLASILPDHQLLKVLEQAERTQLLDTTPLAALLARHPRRKGTRTLRTALEAYDHDLARLRSELERIVTRACRRLDHPMPKRNKIVMGKERDFVWHDPPLVIEADSRTWHTTTEARERDTLRDHQLTLAAIPYLRITWRQATNGHAQDVIGRALTARL